MKMYNIENLISKAGVWNSIVASATLLYPVLSDFGVGLHAPVLVYLEKSSNFRDFITSLGVGDFPEPINMGGHPKMVRKALESHELNTIICRYENSRYLFENMDTVTGYCNCHLDVETAPLVFVLTDQIVSERILSYFAGALYFDSNKKALPDAEFSSKLINAVCVNQEFLRTAISEISESEEDEIGLFIAAAVCIECTLKHIGADSTKVSRFNTLATDVISKIRDDWELYFDPETYVTAFRCGLEMIISNDDELPIMLEHYHVYGVDVSSLEEALFYDDVAYYFTKNFFNKVCATISEGVGSTYLKQRLASAGLIDACSGKRNYYSQKVEVVTEYGIISWPRRIRVYRAVLEGNSEVSFLELFLMREKKEYE